MGSQKKSGLWFNRNPQIWIMRRVLTDWKVQPKLLCNFIWFLGAVSFLLSTTFCDRVSHLVRSGLNSFPSRSAVRWFQLSMIRIPPAGGIVNPVKIFPDLACCFSTGKTGKKCNYHHVFTSSFASIVLPKLFICHTKSEKRLNTFLLSAIVKEFFR